MVDGERLSRLERALRQVEQINRLVHELNRMGRLHRCKLSGKPQKQDAGNAPS